MFVSGLRRAGARELMSHGEAGVLWGTSKRNVLRGTSLWVRHKAEGLAPP